MKPKPKLLFRFASIMLFVACAKNEHASIEDLKEITSKIDDARLINADKSPGDWRWYGRSTRKTDTARSIRLIKTASRAWARLESYHRR